MDTRNKRKEECSEILPVYESSQSSSPKRAKVHAQRKFAQSSQIFSPSLSPAKEENEIEEKTSPVEYRTRLRSQSITGSNLPSATSVSTEPPPRPKTEDFLTFLCFRRTPMLPPELEFFEMPQLIEPMYGDLRAESPVRDDKPVKSFCKRNQELYEKKVPSKDFLKKDLEETEKESASSPLVRVTRSSASLTPRPSSLTPRPSFLSSPPSSDTSPPSDIRKLTKKQLLLKKAALFKSKSLRAHRRTLQLRLRSSASAGSNKVLLGATKAFKPSYPLQNSPHSPSRLSSPSRFSPMKKKEHISRVLRRLGTSVIPLMTDSKGRVTRSQVSVSNLTVAHIKEEPVSESEVNGHVDSSELVTISSVDKDRDFRKQNRTKVGLHLLHNRTEKNKLLHSMSLRQTKSSHLSAEDTRVVHIKQEPVDDYTPVLSRKESISVSPAHLRNSQCPMISKQKLPSPRHERPAMNKTPPKCSDHGAIDESGVRTRPIRKTKQVAEVYLELISQRLKKESQKGEDTSEDELLEEDTISISSIKELNAFAKENIEIDIEKCVQEISEKHGKEAKDRLESKDLRKKDDRSKIKRSRAKERGKDTKRDLRSSTVKSTPEKRTVAKIKSQSPQREPSVRAEKSSSRSPRSPRLAHPSPPRSPRVAHPSPPRSPRMAHPSPTHQLRPFRSAKSPKSSSCQKAMSLSPSPTRKRSVYSLPSLSIIENRPLRKRTLSDVGKESHEERAPRRLSHDSKTCLAPVESEKAALQPLNLRKRLSRGEVGDNRDLDPVPSMDKKELVLSNMMKSPRNKCPKLGDYLDIKDKPKGNSSAFSPTKSNKGHCDSVKCTSLSPRNKRTLSLDTIENVKNGTNAGSTRLKKYNSLQNVESGAKSDSSVFSRPKQLQISQPQCGRSYISKPLCGRRRSSVHDEAKLNEVLETIALDFKNDMDDSLFNKLETDLNAGNKSPDKGNKSLIETVGRVAKSAQEKTKTATRNERESPIPSTSTRKTGGKKLCDVVKNLQERKQTDSPLSWTVETPFPQDLKAVDITSSDKQDQVSDEHAPAPSIPHNHSTTGTSMDVSAVNTNSPTCHSCMSEVIAPIASVQIEELPPTESNSGEGDASNKDKDRSCVSPKNSVHDISVEEVVPAGNVNGSANIISLPNTTPCVNSASFVPILRVKSEPMLTLPLNNINISVPAMPTISSMAINPNAITPTVALNPSVMTPTMALNPSAMVAPPTISINPNSLTPLRHQAINIPSNQIPAAALVSSRLAHIGPGVTINAVGVPSSSVVSDFKPSKTEPKTVSKQILIAPKPAKNSNGNLNVSLKQKPIQIAPKLPTAPNGQPIGHVQSASIVPATAMGHVIHGLPHTVQTVQPLSQTLQAMQGMPQLQAITENLPMPGITSAIPSVMTQTMDFSNSHLLTHSSPAKLIPQPAFVTTCSVVAYPNIAIQSPLHGNCGTVARVIPQNMVGKVQVSSKPQASIIPVTSLAVENMDKNVLPSLLPFHPSIHPGPPTQFVTVNMMPMTPSQIPLSGHIPSSSLGPIICSQPVGVSSASGMPVAYSMAPISGPLNILSSGSIVPISDMNLGSASLLQPIQCLSANTLPTQSLVHSNSQMGLVITTLPNQLQNINSSSIMEPSVSQSNCEAAPVSVPNDIPLPSVTVNANEGKETCFDKNGNVSSDPGVSQNEVQSGQPDNELPTSSSTTTPSNKDAAIGSEMTLPVPLTTISSQLGSATPAVSKSLLHLEANSQHTVKETCPTHENAHLGPKLSEHVLHPLLNSLVYTASSVVIPIEPGVTSPRAITKVSQSSPPYVLSTSTVSEYSTKTKSTFINEDTMPQRGSAIPDVISGNLNKSEPSLSEASDEGKKLDNLPTGLSSAVVEHLKKVSASVQFSIVSKAAATKTTVQKTWSPKTFYSSVKDDLKIKQETVDNAKLNLQFETKKSDVKSVVKSKNSIHETSPGSKSLKSEKPKEPSTKKLFKTKHGDEQKTSSAFSPLNESSVYAFEPDLETPLEVTTPFYQRIRNIQPSPLNHLHKNISSKPKLANDDHEGSRLANGMSKGSKIPEKKLESKGTKQKVKRSQNVYKHDDIEEVSISISILPIEKPTSSDFVEHKVIRHPTPIKRAPSKEVDGVNTKMDEAFIKKVPTSDLSCKKMLKESDLLIAFPEADSETASVKSTTETLGILPAKSNLHKGLAQVDEIVMKEDQKYSRKIPSKLDQKETSNIPMKKVVKRADRLETKLDSGFVKRKADAGRDNIKRKTDCGSKAKANSGIDHMKLKATGHDSMKTKAVPSSKSKGVEKKKTKVQKVTKVSVSEASHSDKGDAKQEESMQKTTSSTSIAIQCDLDESQSDKSQDGVKGIESSSAKYPLPPSASPFYYLPLAMATLGEKLPAQLVQQMLAKTQGLVGAAEAGLILQQAAQLAQQYHKSSDLDGTPNFPQSPAVKPISPKSGSIALQKALRANLASMAQAEISVAKSSGLINSSGFPGGLSKQNVGPTSPKGLLKIAIPDPETEHCLSAPSISEKINEGNKGEISEGKALESIEKKVSVEAKQPLAANVDGKSDVTLLKTRMKGKVEPKKDEVKPVRKDTSKHSSSDAGSSFSAMTEQLFIKRRSGRSTTLASTRATESDLHEAEELRRNRRARKAAVALAKEEGWSSSSEAALSPAISPDVLRGWPPPSLTSPSLSLSSDATNASSTPSHLSRLSAPHSRRQSPAGNTDSRRSGRYCSSNSDQTFPADPVIKPGDFSANPNLARAPSFFPTEDEFLDPLDYIEKIRPEAEQFGICRIVPPSNFKPECQVNDDMRFTPNKQYIHRMMRRCGPNEETLCAIKKCLAKQNIELPFIPLIGGLEIDLVNLYKSVEANGGLMNVIEKELWVKVADSVRIPKSTQDRVTKLDNIYCKFLLPYAMLSADEREELLNEVDQSQTAVKKEGSDNEDDDEDEPLECIVKGKSVSLGGFYRIARNFATQWQPDPQGRMKLDEQYWEIVKEGANHVCVHAASIDTAEHGYGFPNLKSSPSMKHPWNLKNLVQNPNSVLRSMSGVIGVTAPTLHVGMMFSTVCWYRDPHSLPWIEYLHSGACKVWYGVASNNEEKLMMALQKLVPDFIKDSSLWLPSDTAMVPPDLLIEEGVKVCRVVQEPGQFVVVFPGAFTSSFCSGYLISESAFFARPQYFERAAASFKTLYDCCEPSMFSLDRLVLSVASDSKATLDALLRVRPLLQVLVEREKNEREQLSQAGLTLCERMSSPDSYKKKKRRYLHEEEETVCEMCHQHLYVSLVSNSSEESVFCLSHALSFIKAKSDQLKNCQLNYTFTLPELTSALKQLDERIQMKSARKCSSLAGKRGRFFQDQADSFSSTSSSNL